MLIFDGNSDIVMLDNIYGPTISDYMWVLDLDILDFTLSPLEMLEETICPSLQLLVKGIEFILPANWNVLVYDRETAQLDVVPITDTAGRYFTALSYGPTQTHPTPEVITVTNYFVEHKNVSPLLNKHQMLCHPISNNEWICISPSDSFNKFLKNIIVGDLIG